MGLTQRTLKALRIWIGFGIVGTLGMVVLGGATRLTESGLSIVEWQLFKGALPPLNAQAWQELFSLYAQTPEFIQKNALMDLEGFKNIFWLEYLHRLWGRVLGLGVIVPGCLFGVRHPSLRWRVTLLIVLILTQGVIGWVMVQSGLIHHPWVSPYRLCLHLVFALILFLGFLDFWVETGSQRDHKPSQTTYLGRPIVFGVFSLCVLTLCFGAFVAGLDAGLIYNTFPMMDAHWLPDRMWGLSPLWRNIFENPGTVQWIHRLLATMSLLFLCGTALFCLKKNCYHTVSVLMRRSLILGWIQVLLGICTLLYQVPLILGLMHQFIAFLLIGQLWVLIVRTRY